MRFSRIISALLLLGLIQCKEDCIKSDRCQLEPESGPCYANFTRYYFDKESGQCKSFGHGGCAGVVPFDTLEECQAGCQCK